MNEVPDFTKDLLIFAPMYMPKNILEVWMQWDSGNNDYLEETKMINPKVLFENRKLIYCLAYITWDRWGDNKGHNPEKDAVFGNRVTENKDINDLMSILTNSDFVIESIEGPCHSCICMRITYYDEGGKPWLIDFSNIDQEWRNMSYEEICDQINKI